MQKLSISNGKIYAGSGFMQSDQTQSLKDKMNCINFNNENQGHNGQSKFNAIDFKDNIHTGFLYYLNDRREHFYDSFYLYKYGFRKLSISLPTYHNNEGFIKCNVLMPDLLFVKKRDLLYISFLNINKRFVFHNVFSDRYSIDRITNQVEDFNLSNRFNQFCTGQSVTGINFSQTPELYCHTLLTGESNYDLSFRIDMNVSKAMSFIKNKYQFDDQQINLNDVSDLFNESSIQLYDLLNCESTSDIVRLIQPHISVRRMQYLYNMSSNEITTFDYLYQYLCMHGDTFYAILVGLFSTLDNVALIEDLLNNL